MAFSLLRLPEQSKCPKVDKRSSTTVCWLWRSVVKREKKSSVISFTGSFLSFFTPFHPLSHPDRNFLIPGSVLTCCCKNWLEVVKDSGHLSLSQLLTYNRLNGKATSLAWKIVSQSKLRTLEWKFGMIYWVLIENSVRPMPAPISPLFFRLGPNQSLPVPWDPQKFV